MKSITNSIRLLTAGASALLLTACLTLAQAAAPPSANQPFQASPALTARLASAPTKIGGLYLRLPPGYALQSHTAPSGSLGAQTYLFTKANQDGTRPIFFVVIAPIPAAAQGQNKVILDSAVQASNAQLKQAWSNLHISPVVSGTIAGGPFQFVAYTGRMLQPNLGATRPASAIAYYGCVGGRVYGITSRDTAPYAAKSLPLAKAAVLTLAQH